MRLGVVALIAVCLVAVAAASDLGLDERPREARAFNGVPGQPVRRRIVRKRKMLPPGGVPRGGQAIKIRRKKPLIDETTVSQTNVVSEAPPRTPYPGLRKKFKVKRKKVPTLQHLAGVAPPTPGFTVKPTESANFFPKQPPIIEDGSPNNRSKEESRCKYISSIFEFVMTMRIFKNSLVTIHDCELPKRSLHFWQRQQRYLLQFLRLLPTRRFGLRILRFWFRRLLPLH